MSSITGLAPYVPVDATSTAAQGTTRRHPVAVDPHPDTAHISLAATRQLLQLGRVLAGTKNGNLTSDESSQIDSQLKDLHSQISAAKSSDQGTVSGTQKQDINQLQNQISAEIFGYTHNGNPIGSTAPPPAA